MIGGIGPLMNQGERQMKHAGFIAGVMIAATSLTAGVALAQGPGFGGPGFDGPGPRFSFQELDADGNGEVTREEMQAHRAARFAEADSDGDGKLSLEEMQAQAQKRAAERAANMLKRLDTDGDGALSPEEMPGPRREGRMDRMFEHMDQDESGGISEQEFTEAREQMRHHRMEGHGWMKHHGKMRDGCDGHGRMHGQDENDNN